MATPTPPTTDPRAQGRRPPFDERVQRALATETRMNNGPDHGESSHVGHGKLAGRVALVTGADRGDILGLTVASRTDTKEVAASAARAREHQLTIRKGESHGQ
jgi:hypothetical protein